MKAIEFQCQLGPDRTLTIPASVSEQIPTGCSVRVLVLLPESTEDQAWEQLAAADFGMGYGDSDTIYDKLSNR